MTAMFITATGTDIGKTFVGACLTWQLRKLGKDVRTVKPVISGYVDGEDNDTTLLQALQPETSLDDISPWRYQAAISPHQAAALENRPIDPNDVVRFCRTTIKAHDVTLIEGIGGAMVPLRSNYLVTDWMKELAIPVLVITGSYLGTFSHTFTCLESLFSRGLDVKGVIVSQSEEEPVALTETVATLQTGVSNIPFIGLPRITKNMPWKHAPDLTIFLD